MINKKLEMLIKEITDELIVNSENSIKKAILNSENPPSFNQLFDEEKIIKRILKNEKAIALFDFKQCGCERGQPCPSEFLSLLHSRKYDFYYQSAYRIYEDEEIVEKLANDDFFEILVKTDKVSDCGSVICKSEYVEKPLFVCVYTFEKPDYNVFSIKIEYGFYELLEEICGINTDKIKEIIEDCRKRVEELSYSASYYAHNDKEFQQKLFDKIFADVLENYDNFEIKKVIDFIMTSPYSSSVIKMLLTYNYTNSLYKKFPNDCIDLTFITVSLFKVVEVLLCDFINTEFKNIEITSKNGKIINLSRKDLTLGEMNQIFYCDDVRINNYIKLKKPHSENLKSFLAQWIKYSRNGFLHKDTIDRDNDLEIASLNSLDIIFFLVLTFY